MHSKMKQLLVKGKLRLQKVQVFRQITCRLLLWYAVQKGENKQHGVLAADTSALRQARDPAKRSCTFQLKGSFHAVKAHPLPVLEWE